MTNLVVSDGHAERLRKGYEEVAARTWLASDFQAAHLASSRDLFTPESLAAGAPRPKPLEVYALLSGLPFPTDFVAALGRVLDAVHEVIGPALRYWVRPENLGVEYCVFKWPTDGWRAEWLPGVRDALSGVRAAPFDFTIGGIQVNPDGCVVARGFDERATIFRVREHARRSLSFLPARQSNWAHVPLGRILEPIGTSRFARLRTLMADLSAREIATARIGAMKLVHETRWYMEEKTVLQEYTLAAGTSA